MHGLSLLLSFLLAGLAMPGASQSGAGSSWVQTTTLAAQVQNNHGVTARPVLGFRQGEPLLLAIVDAGRDVRMELHTWLAYLKMQAAARRDGVYLTAVSGFRTQEQQRELFRDYQRGRGPLASKPGYSNHQSGHALDLDVSRLSVRKWMKRHAHRFGFKRTVPSEKWHWEHW